MRIASLVVFGLSLALPSFMHIPARLPSVAMGSALLLYLERVLVVFGICLFLLVFLYRGLWRGELPRAVSGRGAEWQDLGENAAAAIDPLRAEVQTLRQQVEISGGRGQGGYDSLMTRPEVGREREVDSPETNGPAIGSPEWWEEWDRRSEVFDRADQQYLEARERLLKRAIRI